MKMIDNIDLQGQLEMLARVSGHPGEWYCATVEAGTEDAENAVARGFQIEKSLASLDGAVLVEPPDRLRVLVPSADRDRLDSFLTEKNWPVTAGDMAPAQLKALVDTLERHATKRDAHSTLYMHRSRRSSNVIMVADDDALMCAALKGGLERYGQCVFAHDAAQILPTYIRHSPDCLFLDLHLGYESGMEAITAILEYDRDAHIVMLTADSTATHAVNAKARGAKSFIAKPLVLSRVEYELFRSPTFRRWAG